MLYCSFTNRTPVSLIITTAAVVARRYPQKQSVQCGKCGFKAISHISVKFIADLFEPTSAHMALRIGAAEMPCSTLPFDLKLSRCWSGEGAVRQNGTRKCNWHDPEYLF